MTNESSIIKGADYALLDEAYSYEALWLREKASFKSIASLFQSNPGKRPSDLVTEYERNKAKNELVGKLSMEFISKIGISINQSKSYPTQLRSAVNPIELFYYKGNIELAKSRTIAIIRSRKVSEEGKQRAHRVAKVLCQSGFTIVSGLAEGVDVHAHLTAMKYSGNTIAVIGTSLDTFYPKQHKKIQEQIAAQHLLISQVPFLRYHNQDFRVNRHFFPERNATMSALSEATLIVEANDRSGTLTQAKHAIKQNRKLFILNNCFEEKANSWPWKYLELGAVRVKEPSDIIDNLNGTRK